jgi:hypothetical protein
MGVNLVRIGGDRGAKVEGSPGHDTISEIDMGCPGLLSQSGDVLFGKEKARMLPPDRGRVCWVVKKEGETQNFKTKSDLPEGPRSADY